MAENIAQYAPYVFVAYANDDRARVNDIVKSLRKCGLSVFWDQDVPAGENWHKVLLERLKQAHCVLVVWSEASIASEYVIEEAHRSVKHGTYFPMALDTLDEAPYGFALRQIRQYSIEKEDSRDAEIERLHFDILEFLDRRNYQRKVDVDSTKELNDEEMVLIQTVNRIKQLQHIQSKLEENVKVLMFLYSGKPVDWPKTLANHLKWIRMGESEVHSLMLDPGFGRNAFKSALERKLLPPGVHSDEKSLLDWFTAGPTLRIIVCELLPNDLGSEFKQQVRGAAEFLQQFESQSTQNRLVLLFACTCKRAPTIFTNWWRSRFYAGRSGVPLYVLRNLEAITGEHADNWVTQVQDRLEGRYWFDDMKPFLAESFKKKKSTRYLDLKPVLEKALLDFRR